MIRRQIDLKPAELERYQEMNAARRRLQALAERRISERVRDRLIDRACAIDVAIDALLRGAE